MPIITVNNRQIPYLLARSARVKRMRLEWGGLMARIIAPKSAANQDILDFLFSQKQWLGKQASKVKNRNPEGICQWPKKIKAHDFVPFWGTKLKVRVDPAASNLSRAKRELVVGAIDHKIEIFIQNWLKQEALRLANHWGKQIGDKLGVHPRTIKIKDQKTRWGSCGIHNDIHLNWRLICMPLPVFKYVVVHEYCHLKYRNHGKRFWALVAKIQPDYKEQEKWLRTYASLMFEK